MAEHQRTGSSFARNVLPWIVCAAGLFLYLFTLQPWLSLRSLAVTAKVLGWDWWAPNVQNPLYFLVTYPVRWLPQPWQISALNGLAAVCAAGTLGILARSVALLPHDRTIYQRLRERSADGLLSLGANWLPPLLAAGLLAVQMTFWENAVAASQEALNVLLFAGVILCLLEYRLSRRDAWLYGMAFVYGLATTNNWAMIGFFPLVLMVVAVMKKGALLQRRFLLAVTGCGLAGLTLYLVMPAVEAAAGRMTMTYWELLRWQLSLQASSLLGVPKWVLVVLGISSLLPALNLAIRWPSQFGDTSPMGATLTQIFFQIVHALFLAVCVAVFFDPRFSPRGQAEAQGFGISFLTFYHLSALAAGYYSGYFLLIGSVAPEGAWRRAGPLAQAGQKLALLAVWALLPAAPAVVAWRNAPSILGARQSPLRALASHLTANLPAKPAALLSDNPLQLLLVQADYHQRGEACPHLLLDTRALERLACHRLLAARFPDMWKDHFAGTKVGEPIPGVFLIKLLADQARTRDVIYLHPSFGYYFEAFYSRPMGLVAKLKPYQAGMIEPPPLPPQETAANQAFWMTVKAPAPGAGQSRLGADEAVAGRLYARAATEWGVLQQRAGKLPEAKQVFELALAFFPSNRAASINLAVNNELQAGRPASGVSIDTVKDIPSQAANWNAALNEFGFFDEPRLCFSAGQLMAAGGLPRQAALQFIRARTLDPTNTIYHLAEAEMYLQGAMADKTLATLDRLRTQGSLGALNATNQMLAVRLEAMAHAARTNFAAAEQAVRAAEKRHGGHPILLETLAQTLTAAGKFSEALGAVERRLALDSDHIPPLLHKAALHMQLNDAAKAVESLDAVLKRDPKHAAALEMRAVANLRLERYDDARADSRALQKLNPASSIAELGLGEAAHHEKKFDEAVRHFEKALELAPAGSAEAAHAGKRLEELKNGRR